MKDGQIPSGKISEQTSVRSQLRTFKPRIDTRPDSLSTESASGDSSLEGPEKVQTDTITPDTTHHTHKPVTFSRRKAVIVSTVITLLVIMISVGSLAFLTRGSGDQAQEKLNVPIQEVNIRDGSESTQPIELSGASEALLVNGDVISRGDIKISQGGNLGVLRLSETSEDRTYQLPDASGVICLDNNNCSYATAAQLEQLQTDLTQLVVPAGTTLNGQSGAVTIQGTTNQITVTEQGNAIRLSTPQDIAQGSSPTFASMTLTDDLSVDGTLTLALNCTAFLNGGSLTTNASGQVICANDETSGAGTSVTTPGGTVGTIPMFTSNAAVGDSIITQTGGNTINIGGTLTLNNALGVGQGGTGATSFTNSGVILGNGNGALTATSAPTSGQVFVGSAGGVPTFVSLSGDIAISSVGVTTVQQNSVALSTDTTGNYVEDIAAGNGVSVSGAAGESSNHTIGVLYGSTANTAVEGDTSITISAGTNLLNGGSITLGTGGSVTLDVVSNPTFSGLITANGGLTIGTSDSFSINGDSFTDLTGTGLTISSGSLQTTLGTNVDLASAEVAGILPVANGGTGLATNPANGQLLIGNGAGYTLATLSGGDGITITNASGSITVANDFGTSIESSEISDSTITGTDIANDTIALGTKTTGNYQVGTTGGNGIGVTGTPGEAWTAALGLSNLTADWNQTGAFDIVLNDSDSQLSILENGASPSLFGVFDVGDLTVGNATYVFPDTAGTSDEVCLKDAENCVGTGNGITGSGTQNRVAKFGPDGDDIVDSTISDDGTNVSITGNFSIQGGGLTLGQSSTATGSIAFHNSTNSNAVTIQSGATGGTGYALTLPTAQGGSGQCLKNDGSGILSWGDCLDGGAGGGGITSIDGQTGPAVTINNATGSGNVITIDDARADGATKGIAAFNATNFSAASGVINTIQGISTAASPQFAGLDLTGDLNIAANNIVTSVSTISSTELDVLDAGITESEVSGVITDVTAGAGLTGGASSGNATLTVASGNGGIVVNSDNITLTVQTDKGLEVDANGLSLIDCASDNHILKYDTDAATWGCAPDAGGTGVGDDVQVNGSDAAGANFIDTAASATNVATTFTLNGGLDPDTIALTLGAASDTTAGIVTAQNQTLAGLKTFNDGITVANGQNLTVGGEAFSDLTGNGLALSSSTLVVNLQSGSGMEVDSTGLSLARDCSSGDSLEWNGTGWVCAANGDGVGVSDLQGAYDGGNTITTTNARDIQFTLDDTATDANFNLTVATGSTGFMSIARADGAGLTDPAQLLLIENQDTDRTQPIGLKLQAATGGGLTTALDVSDTDITNGVSLGSNFLLFNGIRAFSSTSTVLTFEDTDGNDLFTVTDKGTTGDLEATGNITADGNLTASGGTATLGGTSQAGTLTTADNPAGNSQNLTLQSGDAGAGNSGNIVLQTGSATGTQGTIVLGAGGDGSASNIFLTGVDCSSSGNGGVLTTTADGQIKCDTDDGGDGIGATNLQDAYVGGNTITADDANGSIDFTLTEATNFITDIQGTGSFKVQDNSTDIFTIGSVVGIATDLGVTNTSTTALKVCVDDGSSCALTVDTTNNAVDVGGTLDVTSVATFNNDVGIGTGSPGGIFHIVSETADSDDVLLDRYSTDNNAPDVAFRKARGTEGGALAVTTNDLLGELQFWGHDGTSFQEGANIQASVSGTVSTGVTPTSIIFNTQNDSGTLAEVMRITDDRKVCINGSGGTCSPFSTLDVQNGDIRLGTNDQYLRGVTNDGNNSPRLIGMTSADFLQVGDSSNLGAITFLPGAVEAMRLTSDGELKIGTTSAVGLSGAKLLVTSAEVTTSLRIGDSTNGISFNDDEANKLRLRGTARNDATITMVPEFIGAIFLGDGGDNTGTLTSDFCSGSGLRNISTGVCTVSTEEHNYYEWTTAEATAQDYDMYVRYQIPSDFDSGTTGTWTFNGWATDASSNVTVSIYDADDTTTPCVSGADIATGTAAWSSVAPSVASCDFNADDEVLLIFHMAADQNDFARVGKFVLTYKSVF